MGTGGTRNEAGDLVALEIAQILGICECSFRLYLAKYDEGCLDALIDKRLNQASRRKAPLEVRIQLAKFNEWLEV